MKQNQLSNATIGLDGKRSYSAGIVIIGILFFIFGFVTWLNATLIPYLKIACELSDVQSYLVTFAFYIAYLFMALPSAWVLRRTGYKNGMMLGLFVMAIGALIFIPAAMSRTYGLFLLGLFVMGTGLSILQTASNPYVIELGPPESAAKRVSIMGICNKFAGAISPLILGSVVLKDVDLLEVKLAGLDVASKAAELDALAAKAIIPYAIIMGSLVLLGLFVRFSPLPVLDNQEESVDDQGQTARRSIFSYPHLWIGVLTLFLYVGMEVIAVDTLINYAGSLGISMNEAKVFPTYSMIALIVGYIIGIACIPRYISQSGALLACAVLGALLALSLLLVPASMSIWVVALFSLANSLMWPAIFPLAIFGLGRHTKTGSALLIMAIAGGATLPLLYGYLAEMSCIGRQLAYVAIGLPCYLFILYFAAAGHKVGLPKRA
ncbi:MAG: sugar MFS transporter [Odoribacteraceae bacterium]|jgi:glucose/galactose transporter|nr:sugar MFS transporter [Odoribacteraceae bacterium]